MEAKEGDLLNGDMTGKSLTEERLETKNKIDVEKTTSELNVLERIN